MKLEALLSYRATLKPVVPVGPGPFGNRAIFDVTGGTFEGPRLRGTILPSGADWLLVGADGFARLDVRATFETHDGAFIYLSYFGVLEMNERVTTAMSQGAATDYGEIRFFTAPRFETGDPRYAWLNSLVTVAEGRLSPGAVEYRVYNLANG